MEFLINRGGGVLTDRIGAVETALGLLSQPLTSKETVGTGAYLSPFTVLRVIAGMPARPAVYGGVCEGKTNIQVNCLRGTDWKGVVVTGGAFGDLGWRAEDWLKEIVVPEGTSELVLVGPCTLKLCELAGTLAECFPHTNGLSLWQREVMMSTVPALVDMRGGWAHNAAAKHTSSQYEAGVERAIIGLKEQVAGEMSALAGLLGELGGQVASLSQRVDAVEAAAKESDGAKEQMKSVLERLELLEKPISRKEPGVEGGPVPAPQGQGGKALEQDVAALMRTTRQHEARLEQAEAHIAFLDADSERADLDLTIKSIEDQLSALAIANGPDIKRVFKKPTVFCIPELLRSAGVPNNSGSGVTRLSELADDEIAGLRAWVEAGGVVYMRRRNGGNHLTRKQVEYTDHLGTTPIDDSDRRVSWHQLWALRDHHFYSGVDNQTSSVEGSRGLADWPTYASPDVAPMEGQPGYYQHTAGLSWPKYEEYRGVRTALLLAEHNARYLQQLSDWLPELARTVGEPETSFDDSAYNACFTVERGGDGKKTVRALALPDTTQLVSYDDRQRWDRADALHEEIVGLLQEPKTAFVSQGKDPAFTISVADDGTRTITAGQLPSPTEGLSAAQQLALDGLVADGRIRFDDTVPLSSFDVNVLPDGIRVVKARALPPVDSLVAAGERERWNSAHSIIVDGELQAMREAITQLEHRPLGLTSEERSLALRRADEYDDSAPDASFAVQVRSDGSRLLVAKQMPQGSADEHTQPLSAAQREALQRMLDDDTMARIPSEQDIARWNAAPPVGLSDTEREALKGMLAPDELQEQLRRIPTEQERMRWNAAMPRFDIGPQSAAGAVLSFSNRVGGIPTQDDAGQLLLMYDEAAADAAAVAAMTPLVAPAVQAAIAGAGQGGATGGPTLVHPTLPVLIGMHPTMCNNVWSMSETIFGKGAPISRQHLLALYNMRAFGTLSYQDVELKMATSDGRKVLDLALHSVLSSGGLSKRAMVELGLLSQATVDQDLSLSHVIVLQ
jgi:hypothetical protein